MSGFPPPDPAKAWVYAGRWRDCCASGEYEEHQSYCREGGEAQYLCEHDLDMRLHPRCYLCKPEDEA